MSESATAAVRPDVLADSSEHDAAQLSQYAVISDQVFTNTDGPRLRLMYHTASATLAALPETTAVLLRDGRIDQLLRADRRQFMEYGILVAGDGERAIVLARQKAAAVASCRRKFVLVPTSYCNLGCAYCGQEHIRGAYRGPHRQAIRDRVLAAIHDPRVNNVEVDWFGGEPLMAFAVIRSLAAPFWAAAEATGTAYHSVMATNGVLLDQRKLRILQDECHVQHLEITLDGPADVHDLHRPLKSGGRSFQHIVDTVSAAARDPGLQRTTFSIRTNVDVANAGHMEEFIAAMGADGMGHPRITFSIAPVHSWGNDVSTLQLSRQTFAEREIDWLGQMLDAGLNVRLFPSAPREIVCTAVATSAEVVNTDGAVFSCTEYPLVPSMRERAVSRVTELAPLQLRTRGEFDGWHDEMARGQFPCGACVFLPVCGGACPKAWHEGNLPCPSYMINVQARLALAARLNGLEPAPAA